MSTTSAVGFVGVCGSNAIDGGVSSILTLVVSVGELAGVPLTSYALFEAPHMTTCVAVPFREIPPAGYARVAPSTVQLMPPSPDGPVSTLASTLTAWFTHTLGSGSLGVARDSVTGVLSTARVSAGDDGTPAALTADNVNVAAPLGKLAVSTAPVA